MLFNKIVVWVMAIGGLVGALDKFTGNHLKLGDEFDKGYNMMGPLTLGMAGIVCITPLLEALIRNTIAPVLLAAGIDPSVFAMFLANDMGGYPLAMQLAEDPRVGEFYGALIAAMMGAAIVFNIPVGLGIVKKEKHPDFVLGLLIGLITIPVGGLAGGLVAGYPIMLILKSLVPVIILSILLALGLRFIPNVMTAGCLAFGKLVAAVAYIGLACAAFEAITDVTIIPGMTPVHDAIAIVGEIAIVLAGAFPVLKILLGILNRPLSFLGQKMGLSAVGTSSLIFGMANSIAIFTMTEEMERRSVVVGIAWAMTASAVMGDHLGFTASVAPHLIGALVAAKLVAGVCAVAIALYVTRGKEEGIG